LPPLCHCARWTNLWTGACHGRSCWLSCCHTFRLDVLFPGKPLFHILFSVPFPASRGEPANAKRVHF
jgi:hypothetical protein